MSSLRVLFVFTTFVVYFASQVMGREIDGYQDISVGDDIAFTGSNNRIVPQVVRGGPTYSYDREYPVEHNEEEEEVEEGPSPRYIDDDKEDRYHHHRKHRGVGGKLPECDLPPDSGECTAEFIRVYFDPQTKDCKHFYYSGCGGNPNRFTSFKACLDICSPHEAFVSSPKVLSGKRYVIVPTVPKKQPIILTATQVQPVPDQTAIQGVQGSRVVYVSKRKPHPMGIHLDVNKQGSAVHVGPGPGPLGPARVAQPQKITVNRYSNGGGMMYPQQGAMMMSPFQGGMFSGGMMGGQQMGMMGGQQMGMYPGVGGMLGFQD